MKPFAGNSRKYTLTPDYAELAILLPAGAIYFGVVKAPVACFVELGAAAMPSPNGQATGVSITEAGAFALDADGALIPRGVKASSIVKIASQDYASTATALGAVEIEIEFEEGVTPPATLEVWPHPSTFDIIETELDPIVDAVAFSQKVNVVGGIGPLTFTIANDYGDDALPSGLSIHATTGVISGTPDTPGAYDFKVEVVDSHGTPLAAEQIFTGDVLEAVPVITTDALDDGVMGAAYEDDIDTTGGEGTVVLSLVPGGAGSVAGGLPAGMRFTDDTDGTAVVDTDDGGDDEIADFGEFPIVVKATDDAGRVVEKTITFTVHGITTATSGTGDLDGATEETPYSDDIETAAGIDDPVLELLESGDALPDGLTFTDNEDGTATIAGTPAAATADTYELMVRLSGVVNGVPRVLDKQLDLVVGS